MKHRAFTQQHSSAPGIAGCFSLPKWRHNGALAWLLLMTFVGEGRAQTAGTDQPWSFNVSGNQVYDNVSADSASDSNTITASQISASLSRNWKFRRGALNLSGNGSEYLYNPYSDSSGNQNVTTYGAALGWSYLASPRATWNVSGNLSSSYARDLTTASVTAPEGTTTLDGVGLLPSRDIARYSAVSAGFSYDLSRQTRMRLALNEQNVALESTGYRDTSSVYTDFSIGRQIARSQTIGVVANYSRTLVGGSAQGIQGVSGTWGMPIGKRLNITAAGGVSGYVPPNESAIKLQPTASFGLSFNSHLLLNNDTFAIALSRSVSQTLGFGALLLQGFTASYSVSVNPRLTLGGAGSWDRATDALDQQVLFGRSGSISAAYHLTRTLSLGLNYGIYVRPPDSNQVFSVSLSYGRSWR
jgi:hypothetical protein